MILVFIIFFALFSMIYKIGLTYKRMDILFDELRNEFKENA